MRVHQANVVSSCLRAFGSHKAICVPADKVARAHEVAGKWYEWRVTTSPPLARPLSFRLTSRSILSEEIGS